VIQPAIASTPRYGSRPPKRSARRITLCTIHPIVKGIRVVLPFGLEPT
jgi:hypothetical protein